MQAGLPHRTFCRPLIIHLAPKAGTDQQSGCRAAKGVAPRPRVRSLLRSGPPGRATRRGGAIVPESPQSHEEFASGPGVIRRLGVGDPPHRDRTLRPYQKGGAVGPRACPGGPAARRVASLVFFRIELLAIRWLSIWRQKPVRTNCHFDPPHRTVRRPPGDNRPNASALATCRSVRPVNMSTTWPVRDRLTIAACPIIRACGQPGLPAPRRVATCRRRRSVRARPRTPSPAARPVSIAPAAS